jgi:hypothetical protein
MLPGRLDQLRPDDLRRVQGLHRLLEDHRDLPTAELGHLLLAGDDQIVGVEQRLPRDRRGSGVLHQPHQRERRHGLSAPGLTDDAEELPAVDAEGQLANQGDRRRATVEIDGEVTHVQQRHGAPLPGGKSGPS